MLLSVTQMTLFRNRSILCHTLTQTLKYINMQIIHGGTASVLLQKYTSPRDSEHTKEVKIMTLNDMTETKAVYTIFV